MDPREPVVAPRKVVELGLLAGPENAQRQKAHQVCEQMRAQWHERLPDCGFGRQGSPSPDGLLRMRSYANVRDDDVEHQQRHPNGGAPLAPAPLNPQSPPPQVVIPRQPLTTA